MLEQERNEEVLRYLKEIKDKIDDLDKRVGLQEERINKIEGGRQIGFEKEAPTLQFSQPENVSVSLPPTPPPPVDSHQVSPEILKTENVQGGEKREIDLEQNIGGKWFAKIGVAALMVGISFFIKYAFDNNWINEFGRVMIGIFAGCLLMFFGWRTARKYFIYSQILFGGGIAILYLSIFSAFDFYHLVSQPVAFFLMAVITGIGIFLSLHYNALSLIILSVIGGFFTPLMISTGANNEIGLFSYILILNLAVLFVSFFKKWRILNVIGFFGTLFIFASWAAEFYSKDQLFVTLIFLTAFFLIYSISPLVYNLIKKEKSSGEEQMLTIFSAVAYFVASYALLNDDCHSFMGFFSVIMALYYFLWASMVREFTPEDDNLYNFLAFLSFGFITLAIPIQFKQNVITIGWMMEAIILIILGLKIKKESVFIFGFASFSLAMIKLLFIDSEINYGNTFILFLNKEFFTYFFAIVLLYFSFFIVRKYGWNEEGQKSVNFKQAAAIFLIMANFFTVFSISREIVIFHENQIYEIDKKIDKVIENSQKNNYIGGIKERSEGYYNSNEYKKLTGEIEKLRNRESIALSLFWLFYGIVLILIGVAKNSKFVRVGGIIVLLISVLKLFFYDLWNLGTLYRIISSISLGVILLLISFVYQKYKDKLKKII